MTTTHTLLDRGVVSHDDEVIQREGRMAISFLERWGMVMADRDGEDSAGRAQWKPMSADALVERAIDVASLAADRLRQLKWITPGVSTEDFIKS